MQAELELSKTKESASKISTSEESSYKKDETMPISEEDIKLFRTVFYTCKQELPSDKVNSLLELKNLNGANMKYKNLSYVTINEIQSCISNIFQRDLVEEMLQSEMYALMLDESTDLSVQKHLSLCVRYVKNGVAVTRFLANITLDDGKAHTIVRSLISCLAD